MMWHRGWWFVANRATPGQAGLVQRGRREQKEKKVWLVFLPHKALDLVRVDVCAPLKDALHGWRCRGKLDPTRRLLSYDRRNMQTVSRLDFGLFVCVSKPCSFEIVQSSRQQVSWAYGRWKTEGRIIHTNKRTCGGEGVGGSCFWLWKIHSKKVKSDCKCFKAPVI